MNNTIHIVPVILSRANFGRSKSLLHELKSDKRFKLSIISGASAVVDRFGEANKFIESSGFSVSHKIQCLIDSSTNEAQALTMSIATMQLTGILAKLNPDAVIVVADRYETLAISIAASFQNIPLIHIQGGEISGNIDDKVRNANTALSDFHFTATKKSKDRVIRMGANPKKVFNVGCPSLDLLNKRNLVKRNLAEINHLGVGANIDFRQPYILVSQHSVTTEVEQSKEYMNQIIHACNQFPLQKVLIWPNSDAGTGGISKSIRLFRDSGINISSWRFITAVPPDLYANLLKHSACLVGNSSSFIRESAFLGTPSVIIGNRQQNREIGKNVTLSRNSKKEIISAIKKQLHHGPYKVDMLYGNGKSGKEMKKIILKNFSS